MTSKPIGGRVLWTGGKGEESGRGGQGGEMTQTMYARVNK
jgi:hypothetical protein